MSKRNNIVGLAERCKFYEKNFSPERMIPLLPVIIRLDGNNFSTWTKSLNKPFDPRFCEVMDDITKLLIEETGAKVGYTQSDEITLILHTEHFGSSIYHDGKKQKILSKLTGFITPRFNDIVKEKIGDKSIANFDCRIYQVPNKEEAVNQLIWREWDAVRNSKQGLAHFHFGHKAIEKKNTDVMVRMLEESGVFWSDLDEGLQRGRYFVNRVLETPFTPEEISELPKQHHYFRNPDLVVKRKRIVQIPMPELSKVNNRVDVIFNSEDPK